MQRIKLCKFQGCGNDYLVFLRKDLPKEINDFAITVCNRHFGVGSDGIAVLEPTTEGADYRCLIFNPDGSQAAFSGNGTRCAAAYLYFKNLWKRKELKLETLSGIKTYKLLKKEGKVFWFETELGILSKIENLNISVLDTTLNIDFVNVGNPVCVIFVEDFNSLNWRQIGAEIECHENFPSRTNVVFVKPLNEKQIEIRIWERGAGETNSSGTCSIAAATAYLNRIKKRGEVLVKAVGGTTQAFWKENNQMLLIGTAEIVFCGEFFYG
ncbi:MAG: diaminopimelate epimerase [Pyrinomonadaceae bacterium]|nr:diaminopimelate epimerase [Pyrinomonadaceae bacterium]MCX7640889.1 diaminopimelate epimerase [Pyrinomonadaceae bacterium]MDW8304280.1 diaminopimelate epimerase [Acidobacteriota bacterium]